MRSSAFVEISETFVSKITVRDRIHCIKYLETIDTSKPDFNRMISWMVLTDLLTENPANWQKELETMFNNYAELMQKHLGGDWEKEVPPIILRDVDRSMTILHDILKVTTEKEVVQRIFYLLCKNDSEFDYKQGYDRCVYVMILVASSFCEKVGFDAKHVECFAFYLAQYFLKNIWMGYLLDAKKGAEAIDTLTRLMEKHDPTTLSALKSQFLDPHVFAVNWLMLLFFEQHEVSELLVIWDSVVLNVKKVQKCVFALFIAHMKQVQIGMTEEETMRRINKASDFNIPRLLRDTDRILSDKPIIIETNERRGGIPLGILLIIMILLVLIGGLSLRRVFL